MATAVNDQPSVVEAVSAVRPRTAAPATATGTGSAPDAIGRRALSGWLRSVSRSEMSLMRYTTPERAQKIVNAVAALPTAAGSNNRRPKSRPANTTRFLVHCDGRSEMIRLMATECPGTTTEVRGEGAPGAVAEPGTATGEGT